jgi:hypothetical protein
MSLDFFLQQPSVLRTTLSEFLQGYQHKPIWDTLKQSSDQTIFQSAMLILVVPAVFMRMAETATAFTAIILGLMAGIMWFSYRKHYENERVDNYKTKVKRLERTMKRKKNFFDKSARSLLHRNPALIKVFAKLYVFARFDKKNFKDALITANQLVRIHEASKIGTVLPDQNIDIAEELQRNTMNYIHSMIHSIPSTSIGDFRWENNLNILHSVLQKMVDDIKLSAQIQYDKVGPTIYNPPPENRCGPFPNPIDSPEYSKNWDQYY